MNYMKKNIFHILYIICFLLIFGQSENGQAAAQKQFTVVIDAGHGGNDPGAIGKRGREKNINLNVALKLGQFIENNCNDTRVVYTRKKDTFVPLHRRAEIANNAKADLFISIHTNSLASRNSKVSGTETYTLGLHRTQENLEVAKKENSVILIEDDYKQRYAGFNPNSAESYIIFEFLQDKYLSLANNISSTSSGVGALSVTVFRSATVSILVSLSCTNTPFSKARNCLKSNSRGGPDSASLLCRDAGARGADGAAARICGLCFPRRRAAAADAREHDERHPLRGGLGRAPDACRDPLLRRRRVHRARYRRGGGLRSVTPSYIRI